MDTFDTSLETAPARAGHSGLLGFDFVELYVGNALQAAHFYRSAFGFTPVARAGLETGVRDRSSIVLQQQDVCLVVTSALRPDHPIGEMVRQHGDCVRDVALRVEDAERAFERAVRHGAIPIMEPTALEDGNGRVVRAIIGGPSDFVHSLVGRQGYSGTFLPGFQPIAVDAGARRPLVQRVDHVAFSVERGTLGRWAAFYQEALGFEEVPQEDTATEYSAMRSTVVQSGDIRFPLVEPADGRRKSQVEDYLQFHGGAGAQHVALLSDDIVDTVRRLRAGGIEFLKAPRMYYEMLHERVGAVDEDVAALRELDILLDRDEWGSLLQIFSKPVQSRPTLFFEVIQRNQARGFGSGNIRALFQAMELEQALRGSL